MGICGSSSSSSADSSGTIVGALEAKSVELEGKDAADDDGLLPAADADAVPRRS